MDCLSAFGHRWVAAALCPLHSIIMINQTQSCKYNNCSTVAVSLLGLLTLLSFGLVLLILLRAYKRGLEQHGIGEVI